MTDQWQDLSDDELRERLLHRCTSDEVAQNLYGWLVRLRDRPDVAEQIAAILAR